jgi:chromosomal replication initiation ATPase DnaA
VLREGPTPMSYPQIGALLGGRDHSTIVNLEQVARRAMNARPGFVRAVDELRASF